MVAFARLPSALLFVLCALVILPAAQPQGPPGGSRVQRLLQRAATEGPVRVLVGVRVSLGLEGQLGQDAVTAQRARVAQAQARVIDRLVGAVLDVRRFQVIPFFAARLGQDAIAQLAAMPEVVSIEEDVAEPPLLSESVALIGSQSAWQSGYTGSGWSIAILDTGIDLTHPFFAGRIVSEACYSNDRGTAMQTSTCPGGVPSSTAPGSGDHCFGFDGCTHGTHVAGIAAGRQYAGGPALNGIGRDATIISLKVFTGFSAQECGGSPCVLSYISDQIAALERVYALRNTFRIAAVNLSLGGSAYFDQATCDQVNASRKSIIDQLRSVGIATIAASGNGFMADALAAPACISSVISVGSVNDGSFGTVADAVSDFSNGAPFLTLLAPGQWITSSVVDGFGENSGTSMAAPHVAGAWALLKQRKPLATVTEIAASLITSGIPVADSRPGGTAHARINVPGAISGLRVDYMWLDYPAPGSVLPQPFGVTGWAINMSAPLGGGTGVDAVQLRATPASGGTPVILGTAQYGASRTDVAQAFGAQFSSSGWHMSGLVLAPGVYTLSAHARNTFNGQFSQAASVADVTVQSTARLWIDSPAQNTIHQQPFLFSGWAFDSAAASGPGIDAVHLYAYPNPGSGAPPIFLGVAQYGNARPDVGSAFGTQFTNSGYRLMVTSLPGGPYNLVAFGHSSVTNVFSVYGEAFLTISEPLMNIDSPPHGVTLSQPFAIAGWAIDRGATADAGIDSIVVWAYPDPGSGAAPIVLGQASHGFARPDVRVVFGPQFLNSGFSAIIDGLPPGHSYRLAVYPHSAVSGIFSGRTLDVTIVP